MVFVSDAKAVVQEKVQVVAFAIAGQLRGVAQPDVYDGVHASLAQEDDECG
jgi:hypothetical protein